MAFDFIQDEKFKLILERDFEEIESLLKHKLSKSVLVLSGSLIECLLIEFLSSKPPKGYTQSKILKLTLVELIDLAHEQNLISKRAKDLSTVIRDFRNLIHPGKEIRTKEVVDIDNANIAYSLLQIILKEIKDNYLILYGFNSKDVLQKILRDSNTLSIFNQLIEKLSPLEKNKLLLLLINYDGYIDNKINYIHKLVDELDETLIDKHLSELVNIVETGTNNDAIYNFKIFSNHLDRLQETKKEIVTSYILHYLNNEKDLDLLSTFRNSTYLTNISKNLVTNNSKQLFIKTILAYYRYRKHHETIEDIYTQLMNGLDSKDITPTELYLASENSKHPDNGFDSRFYENDLPF